MEGRPDIQKTRARALLNRFKRGSQPHSFPSLINFNAFLGTIIADTESAFVRTGQRAAVCDCLQALGEPETSPTTSLPTCNYKSPHQAPASSAYMQDSTRDSTKERSHECDGFCLICHLVLPQPYPPHKPRAKLSGLF